MRVKSCAQHYPGDVFYAHPVWVTGQELTARARAHLGAKASTWSTFAIAVGLRGTDAAGGERLKRWTKGKGEPDYEGTIKLLNTLKAIDWDALKDPPGSAEAAKPDIRDQTDEIRGRIERRPIDPPDQEEEESTP